MVKKNYKSKTDVELEEVNDNQNNKINNLDDKIREIAVLTEKLSSVIENQQIQLKQQTMLLSAIMSDLQYVNFGMHNPEYVAIIKKFLNK